jgi:hypothetical protein
VIGAAPLTSNLLLCSQCCSACSIRRFCLLIEASRPETQPPFANPKIPGLCANLDFTSERQTKDRIKKWGLQKNVPKQYMAAIVRKRAKRKVQENKESDIQYRGQKVPDRKIDDFVWRNKLNEESIGKSDVPHVCKFLLRCWLNCGFA